LQLTFTGVHHFLKSKSRDDESELGDSEEAEYKGRKLLLHNLDFNHCGISDYGFYEEYWEAAKRSASNDLDTLEEILAETASMGLCIILMTVIYAMITIQTMAVIIRI
jgi:hypothetical protein